MPRLIVPLVTNETYHIFNKGIDKRNIFIDKSDYLRFYSSLLHFNTKKPIISLRDLNTDILPSADEKLVKIKSYCFLPNHFHLLLEQSVDGGVSEFMKKIGGGYTLYFNEKYSRSGSLFQGTFKRVHVSTDEYYQYLFAYINKNHFVHNLPDTQDIYTTSSLHFNGVKKSKLISTDAPLGYDNESAVLLARDIYEKRNDSIDRIIRDDS